MSTASKMPWSSIGWFIGLALGLFLFFCPGQYAAASEAVVDASILNVRSGPGTGYSVSGTVKKGECLPVLEQQGDWYKVRLAGGKTGWVAGWLVKIKQSPVTSSSSKQAVVKTGVLNVRGGPGTGYAVVGTVHNGDRLQVLGSSGDWYKIKLPDGGTGWVAGWLVDVEKVAVSDGGPAQTTGSVTKQAVVKASMLNVRAGPGTSSDIVGRVKQGDKLPITGSSNGWCKVKLPGEQTGWVAGWLVDVEKVAVSDGGPVQTIGSVTKQAVVKASMLNVRAGPGTSSDIVGRVKQGDKLPIIGSSNGWCKVKLPGGGTGWVAGWLVDVKAISHPRQVPVTGEAVVYASDVNVRGGPGTDHQVVTRVSRGERVNILEKAGEWYKVQLSRGVVGWIAGWLVQVDTASASIPEQEQEQEQNRQPQDNRQQPENPTGNPGKQPESGEGNGGNEQPKEPGESQDEVPNSGARLSKIYVREVNGHTVVNIKATAPVEHNIFTLTGPDRLVVDLKGVKPGDIPEEMDVSSKLVSRLRTGWFSKNPDIVRLVFDVKDAVMFSAKLDHNGKELTLEMYVPQLGDFLKGKIICIDPGHGGHDPGAKGPTGLEEKDVNLDIALLTAHLLRQNGARVVLTRTSDTFVGLEERTVIAQRAGAELFVSIHNNGNPSPSKHGTSTYYRRDNVSGMGVSQEDNRMLARQIQSELLRSLGRHNLGVKQANFVVLCMATMPAVLVEVSFITNPEEEQLLKQDSYKAKAAEAITRGIANYLARGQA